ncbi:phosphotransferase [Psychrosphaera sp.]|nr:phosphotransferase [Psychrosphaera sp.]
MDKTGVLKKVTELLNSSVILFEPEKEARNSVFKVYLKNDAVWYLKKLPQALHFHESSVAKIDATLIPQASIPKVVIFEYENQKFALLSNVPNLGPINIPNNTELVLKALRQIHTLPVWPKLSHLTLPEVAPLIDEYLPNCPPHVYQKLAHVESYLCSSAFQGVLHGDLSKGNIYLTNDHRVGLIDWEFAAIGDVRWDIAAFAVEHSLSTNEFIDLLKKYNEMAKFDAPLFLDGAEYWLVYYWLVTMAWSEQNEFKTLDYRNLTQDMKSIIQ